MTKIKPGYQILAIGSLLLTVVLGVVLRWSFAGVQIEWLLDFDLRRAHSHLGFYGFLFPIIWSHLKSHGVWTPQGTLLAGYYFFVSTASIGFMISGYNKISIVGSSAVLVVWILFSIKNWKRLYGNKGGWLSGIPLSVLFAAAMVLGIAVTSARGMPEVSQKIVRAFLTTLAFGVFIPAAMHSLYRPPRWGWTVGVLGMAGFMTDLPGTGSLAWAPLFVSFLILLSVIPEIKYWKNFEIRRLSIFWFLVALGMGLAVFDNTHTTAIAGIHLLILGPLVGTFCKFTRSLTTAVYDVCLLMMVSSIILMKAAPQSYGLWQTSAAVTGTTLLVLLVLFFLTQLPKAQRSAAQVDLNHQLK